MLACEHVIGKCVESDAVVALFLQRRRASDYLAVSYSNRAAMTADRMHKYQVRTWKTWLNSRFTYYIVYYFKLALSRNPKIVKATTELWLMLTTMLNTIIVHIHSAHMSSMSLLHYAQSCCFQQHQRQLLYSLAHWCLLYTCWDSLLEFHVNEALWYNCTCARISVHSSQWKLLTATYSMPLLVLAECTA